MPAGFMEKIYSSPEALAGLGVMSGMDLSTALTQGAQTSIQYQKQQMEMQEAKRQQQAIAELPSMMGELQGISPQQVVATLAPKIGINSAIQLAKVVAEQQQREGLTRALGLGGAQQPVQPTQEMGMDALPGMETAAVGTVPAGAPAAGAGTNAQTIMQYGVLNGLPEVVQYGQAMLQREQDEVKRTEDRAYKVTDRENERAYTEGQNAVKAQQELDKKLAEVKVPGLELQVDAQPSSDDAKAVKSIKTARSNLVTLVEEYKSLIDKYGSELSASSIGGAKLLQKKAQIALEYKTLKQLGALQQPDRQIIDEALYDPTSWGAITKSKREMKGLVDSFKNTIEDTYANEIRTRGYDDPKIPPVGAKRAPDGAYYLPDPQRPGKYLQWTSE